MKFPAFYESIMGLGSNDTERAKVLGISERSLQSWRAGKLPKNVARMLKRPSVLQALVEDAKAIQDSQPALAE